MNISVIGTKGAGKGTQVGRLAKDFNLIGFSTGDTLRAGVERRTPLGKSAWKYMIRGELVPDDMVNGLVEEWIWTTSPDQGIIFDGFPRTRSQAAFLERTLGDMGRNFDAVVYLKISEEKVIQRLSGRRVCHLCQEEFHLTFSPFKVCPRNQCRGDHLRQLDEDKPEVIETLMNVFKRESEALLRHYRQTGRLIEIQGDEPVDQVHDAMVEVLMPFR